MTSGICVIIPAYNASRTIHQVVASALKHVEKVFVFDDGSTDGTAATASEAGAELIKSDVNKGKGNALKILFQKAADAGYDTVISMDADGQHDPEEIPHLINEHALHPDDIIVGSRMHEKEKIPRGRYNSMHVARFYISFCANQFIEDTQCGFRLYPLSLFQKIRLTKERYVTETEILMKAGDSGYIIRPVKIRAIYDDAGSHFRPVIDVAAIAAYVISYLQIKWLKEGLTSNRPFTYIPNNLRDRIAKHKNIDLLYQFIAVSVTLPSAVVFFLGYILLSPVFNNYVLVRRYYGGFFRILLASFMLPVLLIVSISEKVLKVMNIRFKLVDALIQWAYPNHWIPRK